jgi:predicted Rossmann fold flavoprotein
VTLDELLAYTDEEREKWRAWLINHPHALDVRLQPGGRFATVGALVDHIFLVETRHLARLRRQPVPDMSGVDSMDINALFRYARSTRDALRDYVRTITAADAGEPREIVVQSGTFRMTPRKLFVHIAMIVIIGAGAAGLTAATFAATGDQPVMLLERTSDGGRKILISGGGRCNILPSVLAPERFVTDSAPHLMRGMLRSWPLVQQRAFFEQTLALPLAVETATGKLFPISNRARDVRDALVSRARQLAVSVRFNSGVTTVEPNGDTWVVHTTRETLAASRVIVATGGLSVPATGSDGVGLRIAETLGHRINAVYPALTPLTADPAVHAALSGVSLKVRIRAKCGKGAAEATGGFLFTHRGYSGPAVLDVSHVAVRSRQSDAGNAVVRVQWAAVDATTWEALLESGPGLVSTILSSHLPQRLGAHLLHDAGIPAERRAADLRRKERLALIERLTSYVLPWTGDEGFRKAEVTGGGVALEEVEPRTLESRRHRNLFFCGEILDAFGPIGGHNFAWAWATGRTAGLAAAKASNHR